MRQVFFGLAVLISSACGLIIEIVAGRLLAPYVGMSLYTWTAIIAVVLAGLSAGHWIGGLLASPEVDNRRGTWRVAIALALAAISTLVSLVLLRTISGLLLESGLSSITIIVLLTSVLFLLPSLFVGIVSPVLMKLAVDAKPDDAGRVIGRMYALGTLGSIAGTLSAGYFFISWIGSTGTVILVSGIYATLALLFAITNSARVFLVILLAASIGSIAWWGRSMQAFTSPCDVESDYYCIRIADYSYDSERPSNLMVLDHLVHSINDRDDPGYLYSPYIQFVDEIAKLRFEKKWSDKSDNNAGPRAFFIGGGGYSLPRAWAYDYPNARLVVAEIDPAVTKAAHDFLWLSDAGPRLVVRHEDARKVLQSLDPVPQFDVIFGDAFRDISVPSHLVTREFNREVLMRLSPTGFYAVNVVDRGSNPRFLFALSRTLKKDFQVVEIWISSDTTTIADRVTFVVIASNIPNKVVSLLASRGPDRSWVRWPSDDFEDRVLSANPPVLTDDFAPVDRLMSDLSFNDTP